MDNFDITKWNRDRYLGEIKVNDPNISKYKIQYNGTGGGYIRDEIEKLGGKITDSKWESLNKEGIIYFTINSSLIPQLQKSRAIEGWKIEKDNLDEIKVNNPNNIETLKNQIKAAIKTIKGMDKEKLYDTFPVIPNYFERELERFLEILERGEEDDEDFGN